MATSNGLSRRRPRSNSLRDSLEEDVHPEMQETTRVRDRVEKRDRESDFSYRSKKKRGDKFSQMINKEGEETTEESWADEEEYEGGGGAPQNHRKSLPPGRFTKQATSTLKVTDEVIAVSIPRKARSAYVKRSYESSALWYCGYGEDQNHWRTSTSPGSRSVDAGSPSSSSVSVRQKTKSNRPKTRLPTPSKSSSSGQEDLEIEIAEVLFGLMRQSQSSKEDKGEISTEHEPENLNGVNDDPNLAISSPVAISGQNNCPAYDSSFDVVQKDTIVEAEESSSPVENRSITPTVKFEMEHHVSQVCLRRSEKPPGYENEEGEKVVAVIASASPESQKQQQSIKMVEESGCEDGSLAKKQQSISPEEESALSTKMNVDFQDSKVTEGVSTILKVANHWEEKFKIDLMAPPSMPSSPERERDGFVDSKPAIHDPETKRETLIKDEQKVLKQEPVLCHEKMETLGEKRELLTFDLEKKPNQEGKKQQQQLLAKTILPQMDKSGQPSSVPLPVAVGGWPSMVAPLRYMPLFQAIVPMDENARSSTTAQASQVLLSQPRPKRCATHHYIAHNIHMHQQFAKMNKFWSPTTGSASLCGPNPKNLSAMPSTETMVPGNPSNGSLLGLNLNSTQDKEQVVGTISVHNQRDTASETTNLTDTSQRKLVLQQTSQTSTFAPSNLVHGSSFIFPMSSHQQSVGAQGNQSGPSKSSTSINNASLSDNSVVGVSTKSTTLPTVVSFTYPNLTANEAPYLTIMPNNGYPFSISAPGIKRGTPAQALPFSNGSLYSSHVFHASQLQQPQAHQSASSSGGSSSSHKQSQSGNAFLASTSVLAQEPPKQHVLPNHHSHKLESDANRENPLLVDPRGSSFSQNGPYGQSLTTPLSQMSFALMPTTQMGITCGIGNQCEKQQNKSLKGGVELVPHQAFAMSFASFNGNCTASNLNFSSLPQNHSIFQGLQDQMSRSGYHIVTPPKSGHQKNRPVSEGKIGSGSTNVEDGRKGKAPTSNGQTLVFDNNTRNLNFMSSSMTVNWPPRSVTSAASIAATPSNAQQQHILQHQKHQSAAAARSKSPANLTLPASSIAAKFSNNSIVFSGTHVQNNSSAASSSSVQSSHWKSSTRSPSSSQVPPTYNSSSLNALINQQARAPAAQGETQISFGRNPKVTLTPQGPSNVQSPSSIAGSSTSGSNQRTSSAGGKVSGPPLQQSESSSSGSGQKSSPVCGRNVPSILNTCPTYLSEPKY